MGRLSPLTDEIEPVARYLAVVMPYVKVVGILTTWARHGGGLRTFFALAKSGCAAVAQLDAQVRPATAALLATVANAPSIRAFVVWLVSGSASSGLGAGRPGKARPSHCRDQAVHRRMTGCNTVPRWVR